MLYMYNTFSKFCGSNEYMKMMPDFYCTKSNFLKVAFRTKTSNRVII